MDKQREKLIELLYKGETEYYNSYGGNGIMHNEYIADYLLANGVIVPPFKVGTKVAVIASRTSNGRNLYIFEDIITQYRICDGFTIMCFGFHSGVPQWRWDMVYASREAAEKALKGVE